MRLIELSMVIGEREDEDDAVVEVTTPVALNTELVRSLNPRKGGKPGTRITFANSAGIAVTEAYEAVKLQVAGA